MERIFDTFREGGPVKSFDPSDPNTYEEFIRALIDDSRDFENSILAKDRDEAVKYYDGLLPSINPNGSPFSDTLIVEDPNATYADITDPTDSPNRSSYVSTDVRDAVLLVLPALIRIFGSSENVIDLVPRTEAQVDMASAATDYVNYVFWNDNPGFLTLHNAFKDAMILKCGFVKWWTDDNSQTKVKHFQNISQDQIQLILMGDPQAQIIDQPTPRPNGNFDVSFKSIVSKPIIRVEGVPPEQMRIDRYARSFGRARIVGHERIVYIDELTAMGYPRELCMDHIQTQDVHNFTQEALIRNMGMGMSSRVGDGVLYGEWYIKVDADGDGVAEIHYICTMGEDHHIVMDKLANRFKFACFLCDPTPHTIVGKSVADLCIDIQKIKTNMMRGALDSLAESINPKMAVNEMLVNMDDALNDDVGAVIRVRGDPNAAISYNNVPFVGQQIIPALDTINDQLQRRTGLTDAAKGLDPKALQSSTQVGVDAIINGAQERIELIARILAETGFKELFKGLYDEVCENQNQQRSLRINGRMVNFDTSMFDASMDVMVNPTMGKGSDLTRMAVLQQIKQDQAAVIQQYGLQNPVVGIQEMINTETDILQLSNIRNVSRYFKTPSAQVLQMIQTQPKEPSPQDVVAKAAMEKVKSDTAKAVSTQQQQGEKLAKDDAFRRAQLDQKNQTDQAKLSLQANEIALQHHADMAKIAGDMYAAEKKAEVDRAKAAAQAAQPSGDDAA